MVKSYYFLNLYFPFPRLDTGSILSANVQVGIVCISSYPAA